MNIGIYRLDMCYRVKLQRERKMPIKITSNRKGERGSDQEDLQGVKGWECHQDVIGMLAGSCLVLPTQKNSECDQP
ncbi:hypothetical protein FGO68_gene4307 [Halteria grandinella]|uniref:Uncharacterized protein n=1 Tax=Halteria grandinella TaxID=5974 RepID=A0A8J8T7H5_HALGN|nr:hypothetical protein FGO68_gene4307 [Halteria grandinella]